ncbi:msx2-interacting protein [Aplochiton taeniatus]
MVRETRHLWVGNLPENVREDKIIEHFKRYGRVESVKVLPKRGSEGGVAAFVDFVDIKSAQKAHNSINKMGDRDLRTDYNEPGTIPSAARGLDDSLTLGSRSRDVSGFTRAAGGAVYGPPATLHCREGRYERRLDGNIVYDHSVYGHHERASSSSSSSNFERQRHYDTEYYPRDTRERTLSIGGSGSVTTSVSGTVSSGVVGSIIGAVTSAGGTCGGPGPAAGSSGGSTSTGVAFYHSRSPCHFEAPDPRYESRPREPFTLASVVHRDLYREERGRHGDRAYRRSRSPHSSSHSRNPSPQRLASGQASAPPASPCGSASRSRSSSSDSVSSTSSSTSGSDSSSSSSEDSPARSVQSAAVPAPSALPLPSLDKDEPRRSFGIKVQNLPVRSTDTSLKDGLFHEFKKYGKVTSVQIHGALEGRYGLVFFRQQEDQEKALGSSKGKLFFGMQIEVTIWNGPETESENEFRPLDERIDEFHPKATRTLFIGNLEKTTSYHDLLNIFQRFGEIVDIDIKKVNGAPQYAFLQYCDIASVCKAIKKMDGEYLGNNRLKLGFGKSMPTTCVWLDGLASNTTEQYLTRHFCRYGHVVKVVFDRMKGMSLILYNNIEYAQAAVKDTKGWKIGGSKIKVDFANQESQMAFYRSMQASGQDIRDFYEILSERRDERRTQYEFPTERAFYENIRAPGTFPEDPRRKYPARGREFYTEWDLYQGDFYDQRYFEDPREFRDYRADPYEQDIRKYSYLQREREREKERFDTDRERDHGRRTVERSQSPSHSRRTASPMTSPTLSERTPPGDSERRVSCRSSERSVSCSSLSPPRFEKPDKVRAERCGKSDGPEKERPLEPERGTGGAKDRRAGRKHKGDKEKGDKQRLKKLKVASLSTPSCDVEAGPEPVGAPSPNSGTQSKAPKEPSGKGRLDILPCVVQLTRVKEKEGKLIGHAAPEKQRSRCGNDASRLASLSADHKSPPSRLETTKGEMIKHGKGPKDKGMASLVEVVDKDVKIKSKKHFKAEPGHDASKALDAERLAARKRRFEEKSDWLKKTGQEEEEAASVGPCKPLESASARDTDGDKCLVSKWTYKKEHPKSKSEPLVGLYSPSYDCKSISMGIGLSLELESRLGEPAENDFDPSHFQMQHKELNSLSIAKTVDEGSAYLQKSKEETKQTYPENYRQNVGQYGGKAEDEQQQVCDIGLSITSIEPTDQSLQFQNNLEEPEMFGLCESPQATDKDYFEEQLRADEERRLSVEVTDDTPNCKRMKFEKEDLNIVSEQREHHHYCSQELNEDLDPITPTGSGLCTSSEDDATAQLSLSIINKESKDSTKDSKVSTKADNKILSHIESLKYNIDLTASRFHCPDGELPKLKTTLLGCDEELLQKWEKRIKSDSLRMEMTFPGSIMKHENLRTSLGHDLEPGEVQSDSDSEAENKHTSPKPHTSLSYILKDREERLTDLKLTGSMEKNKFYSFALDKTITPDTKALLERAKTLYSTREDNWSFLPSRFPSSRGGGGSDKEKVELTPRPIPSWYMKKKKIRCDSEGKPGNKKEDLKPQVQERQELFASRFLHSSIFEQDARRLKHLERKDQESEAVVDRRVATLATAEGPAGGAERGSQHQQPTVLFHSRFLELQQQQDKDHLSNEAERVDKGSEMDGHGNSSNESTRVPEPTGNVDPRPFCPSQIQPVSSSVTLPRDNSQKDEQQAIVTVSTENNKTANKEEKPIECYVEVSPHQSPKVEKIEAVAPAVIVSPSLVLSETEGETQQPKENLCKPKDETEISLKVENVSPADDEPPTPGDSEGEPVEQSRYTSPRHPVKDADDDVKAEDQDSQEIGELKHVEISQKAEASKDTPIPFLGTEVKPQPARKKTKTKRVKTKASLTLSPQKSRAVVKEKPATRKSERIDREKLKRASSPRADASRASPEPKATAKSPSIASDSDQNLESSLIHGRTRRRNVRSVYATPREGEAAGQETVESSRSMRKRAADKDPLQQDVQSPPGNIRRGRPPKRGGRRGEDASPLKVDQPKVSEEEMHIKESSSSSGGEVSKMSEGWRSPRTLKGQPAQSSSPNTTPVGKRSSRVDKSSDRATSAVERVGEDESARELEPKVKMKSEQTVKLSEEDNKPNLMVLKIEKNMEDSKDGDMKTTERDVTSVDAEGAEKRTPAGKADKVKATRLKRTLKQSTDDQSPNLRNLEIRVSVDDVRGLLHTGEEDSDVTPTKSKSVKSGTQRKEKEDASMTCFSKDAEELSAEAKEERETEPEVAVDPAAALLARQMELERAVENIAKLAVEQSSVPFKGTPPSEPPPPFVAAPPVVVRQASVAEEEKPANPASETELAAAIDSITAEDGLTDAEGFTAPPTYKAPSPGPLVSPCSNESKQPDTAINSMFAADRESPALPETPKRAGKARAKTPKKSRSRKGAANKKEGVAEAVSEPEPEPSSLKLPESIPEEVETINSKAAAAASSGAVATSVVTSAATCKRDPSSAMTVDTPKEAEQPEVEPLVPQESAFHSTAASPSHSKKQHPPSQAKETSAPAAHAPSLPPPVTKFNVPVPRAGKTLSSLDWLPRSDENRMHPSSQVTVVTSSAAIVAKHGLPPTGNPPLPPDTKASDIDPSSSTLRKILMEPKYVSASNSNAIPTTALTSSLAELPRMCEKEKPAETVRPLPLPPQLPVQHKPTPLSEAQLNFGEKVQHSVISSPTTSVISRIPMSYDMEEAPRISLSNRNAGLSLPKTKFKASTNENNRYQGMETVEDGRRGRSVVEAVPCHPGSGPGSGPGLRVNTSEGVVVLSCSGQKTEGPQRISAKISQVPPASVGDIEFQQSVSKSQIKQEQITPPQPLPTRGPPTPTGYPGILLPGQSYNPQPVLSAVKQERPGCDKSEVSYYPGPHAGTVKMFPQPVTSPKVLTYSHPLLHQPYGTQMSPSPNTHHPTLSGTRMSPSPNTHHPTLSQGGSRMSPITGMSTDRSAPHLKQEPHSPRNTGLSPSHFVKACPPSNPIGSSVVLGPYHSSMLHTSEQSSVIMPPHSVTKSMAHPPHGEARINTPSISYGRRSESLPSPRLHGPPQPAGHRDMVLQSHSGPPEAALSEEEPRHFHQTLRRPSAPQLQQAEALMRQTDSRGQQHYKEIFLLLQQQLAERSAAETRQTVASTNLSGALQSPLVGRNVAMVGKDTPKPPEGKTSHSVHPESGRILGVHPSVAVMTSPPPPPPPPQGVQLMHPSGAASFSVYRDMRGFPNQFRPSLEMSLASRSVPSSKTSGDAELGEFSQSRAAGDAKPENTHLRHATSVDLSQMSRRNTVSPSYPSPIVSPMALLTHQPELALQKGPPSSFTSSPLQATANPATSSQLRPYAKLEPSGYHSIDMVQLLTKYPIVWQGLLALKNDSAAVQLHFVSGNNVLAQRSLPPPEGGALLRVAQRMRLEASPLETVARRMTEEQDYCLLLALPCGRDQGDVLSQTQALNEAFITYLQAKQAAGIINVPNPGSNQPAYVVQIFPPCEFSESHLLRLAPDLLSSISSISPHLMIVISSV